MTKTGKISVIGDKDSVLAFKAVGAETYPLSSGAEAKSKIAELLKRDDCAVIFITEDVAVEIEETLEKLKKETYPIIIPIPTASGSNGFGLAGIRKDVEKAIGADILGDK